MLRFNRSADYRQLDLALKWLRFAVRVLPDGHDERPMFLAALGNGLWMRYERYGEVAAINQAIEAGRESVARAAPAERANHLSDLSISIKARYESLGDPADLDEAVRSAEEGDDGPESEIPANILTNLAGSLCRRYDATGSLSDLQTTGSLMTRDLRPSGPSRSRGSWRRPRLLADRQPGRS
jgi:hypothetical protein